MASPNGLKRLDNSKYFIEVLMQFYGSWLANDRTNEKENIKKSLSLSTALFHCLCYNGHEKLYYSSAASQSHIDRYIMGYKLDE